ncbi:MAG: immunoglobulin domain-containing protein [Limisphaerales bacterium]
MDIRHHLCVLAAAIMCGFHLSAKTPPNDDYENRAPLSGTSIVFSGTTVGATVQTNEIISPQYYPVVPFAPTVWWTWNAPVSGDVSIDLVDYTDDRIRSAPAYIAVWQNVDWQNNTGDDRHGIRIDLCGHSHFTFPAVVGTNYDIQVSAPAYGTFTFRLIQTNAPVILDQPRDRLVSLGGSTFLGVVAGSQGPFTYQWRLNGTNIPQQTWPILSLDQIDSAMAGTYTVVVSNGVAAVESSGAVVIIRSADVKPTLNAIGANSDSTVCFELSGEPLTSFRIESSTNLFDWNAEESFAFPLPYMPNLGLTSIVRDIGSTHSCVVPQNRQFKFYRAVRYAPHFDSTTTPPGSAAMSGVCVNNLRKMQFAKELWELSRDLGEYWWGHDNEDTPTSSDLTPFLARVACPYDTDDTGSNSETMDVSYTRNNMSTYPQCNFDGFNHVLEEPPDKY